MRNRKNQFDETMKLLNELNNELANTETRHLCIVTALDQVVIAAGNSKLSKAFWENNSGIIAYLCERLELSRQQVVIVGILCEIGTPISWRQLGQFLGLTRLSTMNLSDAIEDLKAKGWVMSYAAQEESGRYEGFKLVHGVVTALRKNEKFTPEDLSGLSEQHFIERVCRFFRSEGNDHNILYSDKVAWVKRLVDKNLHLPLCVHLSKFTDENSMFVLLLTINDFALYADSDMEGISEHDICCWFDDEFDSQQIINELSEGEHELFKMDILEYATRDGMAETDRWKLTSSARTKLLSDFIPRTKEKGKQKKKQDRDLTSASRIVAKNLFYNPTEQSQIKRIENAICPDGLDKIQQRLAENKMRSGISCLFYGAPGTGKTETVLQLARATGRDIMQVNIAGLRDKFVGESEKNIKRVFERYRTLCKDCETMPILLFNEADAIFGTRFDNVRSSVEKMDNAIQNIILQEMEVFEGILFATTNLTCNLDGAFDRRFLFKVEFAKPSEKAKTSIWRTMMPELSLKDCKALAAEFDFSGGQIENIARKCKIEYITTGKRINLALAQTFCREEFLNRGSQRSRVGF